MIRVLFATMLAFGAILGVNHAARAASFDFTYVGASAADSGSGTLTTGASDPAGSFFTPSLAVTGISGTFGGQAITGLSNYQGADNILYYPSTQTFNNRPINLDFNGIGFSTARASVDLYFGLAGDSDVTNGVNNTGTFTVTPASTAVPEPGSLALLGTGLLGLFVVLNRKRFTI